MPKFVQEILEIIELNEEFMEFEDDPNLVWINAAFEIPDFPENSDEETLIPDAFVFDNIETM